MLGRRKGFGEQVQEKVTPQSQKSTGQVVSENVTGFGDKISGAVQPSKLLRCNSTGPTVLANRSQDEDKSTFQKVGDSTRSNADSAQNEGGSFLDSTKDTLSGVASSASDTLSNAGKCPSSQL
jgi:hypothetical protein